MREHRHDIAIAHEVDRLVDRLEITLAAPDGKAAAGRDQVVQRPPVELRLCHEAEKVLRPEREAERPGIQVRGVVGREDVAALRGQVLLTLGTQSVQPLQHRPGEGGGERIEGTGLHAAKYLQPGAHSEGRYGVLDAKDPCDC